MPRTWIKVPLAQAIAHPLYGIRNWLAVFAFGALFGFLQEVGAVATEARRAGLSMSELLAVDHPAITFLKAALFVEATLVLATYWLLLTKNQAFRQTSSVLLLASWPLIAAIGVFIPDSGIGVALALSIFPWAIRCAVWVTYLNRSRRVRVTYENCILSDEGVPRQNLTSPGQHAAEPMQSPPYRKLTELAEAQDTSEPAPNSLTEEALWANALSELEGDERRMGLWAKCFSVANGNESQAKASYLRERVNQLLEEQSVETRPPSVAKPIHTASRGAADIALDQNLATEMDSPEECKRQLVALGCKVSHPSDGVWEILHPSGVTSYARSPEALQTAVHYAKQPAGAA